MGLVLHHRLLSERRVPLWPQGTPASWCAAWWGAACGVGSELFAELLSSWRWHLAGAPGRLCLSVGMPSRPAEALPASLCSGSVRTLLGVSSDHGPALHHVSPLLPPLCAQAPETSSVWRSVAMTAQGQEGCCENMAS